ncbi:MAG: RNA 3'-terminal phosphate cyclase [Nitrososphaerales archaeon]|nr:RNA 3'-terminal phosphate cyclase [Nitrososphaerales archaeon]
MKKSLFFEIDGSFGEGGGQILRTSITLSVVLNKPIKIKNIRAKRKNTGLRPQHVTAVKLLAEMCDAEVQNLQVGANWITFKPGQKHRSSIKFDVGTAGSIPLILIAALPAASLNGVGCDLEIKGGTDVKWSPTIDYFQFVVLPAFKFLGMDCTIEVGKRGYFPRGGGIVKANIKPLKKLKPLQLVSRINSPLSCISICSNLPKNVAERQMRAALESLYSQNMKCNNVVTTVIDAIASGSSITLYSVNKGSFLGADNIGEQGKPAENVGEQVAQLFLKEYLSEAPIDMHLGDMLVTPLFLATGESKFKVSSLTQHIRTSLHVASVLTERKYYFEIHNNGAATITIKSDSTDGPME